MKTLVIVDVQRDFFHPEGALYVPGAEELPSKIATVIKDYDRVVLTLDWHPGDHCSFKEQGGIWPAHCVAYTQGAGLPDCFAIPLAREDVLYYCKGRDKSREEYGAFESPSKEILEAFEGADSIDVCGIVGEYCVMETMKNIASLGFKAKMRPLKSLIAYFDGGVKFEEFLRTLN